MTAGAIAFRHDNVVGDGKSYPGSGNKGQRGKFRIDAAPTPRRCFGGMSRYPLLLLGRD